MKIVDGVDLKVLLKYGFKRYPAPINEYYKIIYFDNRHKDKFIAYGIKGTDRLIRIETVNLEDKLNNRYVLDNTLYELMLDNLIEEVKYED